MTIPMVTARYSAMTENVRCYSAQALGRIGGDEARKAVEGALSKTGLEVERAATLALGHFADPAVLKVLEKESLTSPDPLNAGFACLSIANVLNSVSEDDWKQYPDKLREIALAPKRDRIRAQYANLGLAFFNGFDKDTRKFYVESLEGASLDKDTRAALAMAAGLTGMSTTEPSLAKTAAEAGADPKARGYAALAYGMIGQATPKETVKALKDIFKSSEDQNVKRGAVLGLGFVGDRADVPFLLDIIAKTSEDQPLARFTRGAAVVSLGLIRDGESIAKIQQLAGHADPRTRAYALAALGHIADKDGSPAMTKLFEHGNFRREFHTLAVVMSHL